MNKIKWFLCVTLLLVFCFLSGCAGTNPEKLMEKPAKTELQEQALQQIDQDLPIEAIKEVRQISLSEQSPAECVVTYRIPQKDGGTPELSGIIVEQYQPEEKSWHKVWEDQWEFVRLEFLGKEKLMDDDREQIAIGGWSGNGGYFEFVLLGEKHEEITDLFNNFGEGIPNGGMKFDKEGFIVQSGSQGTYYEWNGKDFSTTPVVIPPDLGEKRENDIIAHYAIDTDLNTTSDYSDKTINMHVGEKLYLIRDAQNTNGITERIMSYADDGGKMVLDSTSWSVFEAKQAGETKITIIPDGYNWDKALDLQITVSNK
ncbi:MAG: hypothetical protein U9N81_09485 [Bacillota bacterium]|nr:hypothetical protein [Bacillota bacterium]